MRWRQAKKIAQTWWLPSGLPGWKRERGRGEYWTKAARHARRRFLREGLFPLRTFETRADRVERSILRIVLPAAFEQKGGAP